MADDIYWVHQYKLKPGMTQEAFEQYARDETIPRWLEVTGCKRILLFRAMELPWSPNKSEDYDYLAVSVWDKQAHRQFVESGGLDRPEVQAAAREIMDSAVGSFVGSLGSIELAVQTEAPLTIQVEEV